MSRFFPHTLYGEDQPLAHTVLTSHVMHRGFQTGVLVGFASAAARQLHHLSSSASQLPSPVLLDRSASVRVAPPKVSLTVFSHAGIGAMAGAAVMAATLSLRMSGKEEIEWQDRAWRLLENQSQLRVDDWSISGALAGAVSSFAAKQRFTWTDSLGRTGLGSIIGVMAYLTYQYGLARVWEKQRCMEKPKSVTI